MTTSSVQVLEEFVERASWRPEADMFAPPFRDRMSSGELGPEHDRFEYAGDRRPNAQWDSARKEWSMRPYWDGAREEDHLPDPEPEPEPRKTQERLHAGLLRTWMRTHSQNVPMRELEVYTLFYIDGCTQSRVAHLLGISRHTVRNHAVALRRRAGLA